MFGHIATFEKVLNNSHIYGSLKIKGMFEITASAIPLNAIFQGFMIAIVTTTFIMQNEFVDQLLCMRHTLVDHGLNSDLTSRITFSHRILSETIQGVKRLKQGIMLWQKVSAGFNKSGIGLDRTVSGLCHTSLVSDVSREK